MPLYTGVDEPGAVELPCQPARAGAPLALMLLSNQQEALTLMPCCKCLEVRQHAACCAG